MNNYKEVKMEEENTKGKMSSTWWIVIAIVALIVIVLVVKFAMLAPEEENVAAGVEPQQQQEQQVINVTAGKMLSGLTCAESKLTAVFTNIKDTALDLTKDVVFSLNDAVDKTPGCDKTSLNPGESTTCTGLDVVRLGYKPSLVVKVGVDKETLTTICG